MKIGVLGAGTWGMALARMLAKMDYEVTVWSAVKAEIEELQTTGRQKNLPDMELPSSMRYTLDLEEVCTGKDIVLFAVASVYVRATAKNAAPFIPDGQVIVNVSKGIESDTLRTMTQIIEEEMTAVGKRNAKYVALSGPTHAEDVAHDQPTLAVSACPDLKIAIGHFGMVTTNGWQKQIELARNPNVYIESGGLTWLFHKEFYPYAGAIDAILEARDICGMNKLMWGSDYPRTMTDITYIMAVRFIEETSKLTDEEKAAFLGGNAVKFYGFEGLKPLAPIENML